MSTDSAIVPVGYKQTEVGVIPEDWKVKFLLDVVELSKGQVDPKKYPYCDMILVAPEHVEKKSGRLLKKITATEMGAISGKYRVNKGDIVYGKINPHFAKAIFADYDGLCSADMYPIKSKNVIDNKFVFYWILGEQFTKFATSVSARSGIPKINREEMREALIVYPSSKKEQVAIAEILSDADSKIQVLENLITKKRDIKQGAMQELLTVKTRLPGFSGEWEVKQLNHLCSDIKRGASPRPITNPKWFDNNSQIGWVRISDATSAKRYLLETKQKLSGEGVQRSRYIPKGNLIMSICATVGRPIQTQIDVCIHDGFVIFENIFMDQNFLYYVLCDLEPRWSDKGQTGSQMNLNTELIKSTEISLPSDLLEQEAIAEVLSDMDAEIAALEERLEKAKAIKQGMMQQLLTGKIRLVEPQTSQEVSA